MLRITHSIVGAPYSSNPRRARDFSQPIAPCYLQPTAQRIPRGSAQFQQLLSIATASVDAELRARELQQQNIPAVETIYFAYPTNLRLNPTAPEFITPPPSTPSSPLRATAKPFLSPVPTPNANSDVEIEKSENESENTNLVDFVIASLPVSYLTKRNLALKPLDTTNDDDNISDFCLDSPISEGSHNSKIIVDDDFSDSKWITRNGRSYSFDNSDEFLFASLSF